MIYIDRDHPILHAISGKGNPARFPVSIKTETIFGKNRSDAKISAILVPDRPGLYFWN